jgi:hypothetical protein
MAAIAAAALLCGCSGQSGENRNAANLAAAQAAGGGDAASGAPRGGAATPATASIPSQYHGIWAERASDCDDRSPTTSLIEIGDTGWTGWEESARVVSAAPASAPAHGGGDSYRVTFQQGSEEQSGAMTLRPEGEELVIVEQGSGPAVATRYVRCG